MMVYFEADIDDKIIGYFKLRRPHFFNERLEYSTRKYLKAMSNQVTRERPSTQVMFPFSSRNVYFRT